MRSILFILLQVFSGFNSLAQAFLSNPIDGTYGKDYIIVNYVDWITKDFQDAYCGTKSYDGHQGTDFTIRSFAQMDSGVAVLSADSGVVTFILDSLFDRETVSDTSKGLGNYLALKHPNGYFSYYGHLKKNSIVVSLGDTISVGEKIAEIGSSGNSSDPHLHFELWFDSSFVVDPFKGDCGNNSSLWIDSILYDTSFNVWEHGLHLKNININTLREREKSNICCPYEITPSSDTLSFWAHLYGFRKNDSLSIRWINPNKINVFQYTVKANRDWWYYYFFSYIKTDNLSLGKWNVELLLNQTVVVSDSFEVKQKLQTFLQKNELNKHNCNLYSTTTGFDWKNLVAQNKVEVFKINGKKVQPKLFFTSNYQLNNKSAIYIIKVQQESHNCIYKVIR